MNFSFTFWSSKGLNLYYIYIYFNFPAFDDFKTHDVLIIRIIINTSKFDY